MIDVKSILKKTWPHLVAFMVFVTLTMVYFAPEIFDGKQLPQGDMISAQGMGHDAKLYHEQTGEWSHWSNGMFGGMPYNVTSGVGSNNVFQYVAEWIKVGLPRCSSAILWLLLLGFYVFMLACGASPWLAIVGAIAFAFGSYNIIIIQAGHVTKAWVLATVPALVGGCMLCFRGKYAIGFIVTLLATALNVYWNHQQISYYTILMLLPLAIAYLVQAIREKQVKQFAIASVLLVFAAVFAAAPDIDKLVPMMDYSKETMRGGAVLKTDGEVKAEESGLNRDYAFSWSYGKAETMTLLIPNFYGGSSNYPVGDECELYDEVEAKAGIKSAEAFCENAPMYWGDQPFTSGPVYAGAIICFLFVLGLLVVKGPERWWLLVAAIIGILLSWGRNLPSLNNFLFDYLPLYNKFRTPSMSLVMTTTAMAMLGMLALKEVLDKKVILRDLYIASGVTAALCLLFALIPGLAGNFTCAIDEQFPDWLKDAIVAERRHMLVVDAWRSFFFIVCSAALLWVYLKYEKLNKNWIILLLGVLILVDLWTVDRHYLSETNFEEKTETLIEPTTADEQILQDTDPDYRVLNLTSNVFNESRTSYFHKSVGGYSPAKLRRYQDIIDYYLNGSINMNVINMLNTRYVITRQGVQRNPEAFGNAWFVEQIQWVNNPNEEIEAIGDADLQKFAIVDTCWRSKLTAENNMLVPGTVALVNYANPGNIFYETESEESGLVVFSEVYYKTWKAYVDGVQVPVIRANYILRAIEVPAGKHQIELKCEDDLYLRVHTWSLVASILAILGLLVAFGMIIWNRIRNEK